MTRSRLSFAVLAVTVAAGAQPALAHAILTDSVPKPAGSLPPGHQKLHFIYNSRIDHKRSRLTLTGPDGKHAILPIDHKSAANALDSETDLVPGSYTVRWQALALDGHITRGDVPFTVTGKPDLPGKPDLH